MPTRKFAADIISKVPAVTLGFWLIKILATTLGETGGDTVTMSWLGETTDHPVPNGYLIGTAIFGVLLIALVWAQIRARRFNPWLYWATIVGSTTCGTTLADFADRSLGIGYPGGSILLLACVLLSLFGCGAALLAASAQAGPPFLTDDPVPTDIGHWEIYAFSAAEGRRSDFDGAAGLDLNYGPVKDVQFTATLPLGFSHVRGEGWQGGSGDVELGVKYRFFHDEERGLSASVFPRVILPTAGHSPDEKTRLLLPLWIGKDFAGGTSIFGGGGYLINSGSGNRNVWQAAIAVTHELSEQFLVGAEVTQQGADVAGGTAQTRAGLGTIIHLSGPASLLVSGGPTWTNRQTGYHLYSSIGFVF